VIGLKVFAKKVSGRSEFGAAPKPPGWHALENAIIATSADLPDGSRLGRILNW